MQDLVREQELIRQEENPKYIPERGSRFWPEVIYECLNQFRIPVYQRDVDGKIIIPLDINASENEIIMQDEDFYKDYITSGTNVTAEPDPFVIVYPKRLDHAQTLNNKVTYALIGTGILVTLLICVVLVPLVYHTILHFRDRARAKVRDIKRKRKEKRERSQSKLDISIFNDSEEERRNNNRAETLYHAQTPPMSARTLQDMSMRFPTRKEVPRLKLH